MRPLFANSTELARKAYTLARPYGRKKLALVTASSLAQGLFQVLGVTSVFPFLALASDPSRLRESPLGQKLLGMLPEMDDARLLFLAGVFAVLVLFLSNAVNLLSEFVRTRYAHHFGHWLRCGLIRKIAARPYGDFLQQNTAVLAKKIVGDVSQYTTGVLLPLLDSTARAATILLLVATLFVVHPTIAVFAASGLGAFYLLVFRVFGTWRKNASQQLVRAQRGTYVEAQQLLGGIKPVKIHACEEPFIARFAGHSASHARLMSWAGVLANGPRYLIEPLAFGGVVVAVLVYSARGDDLFAILPTLGVMALAGYRLLPTIQLLYGQMTSLTTMRHSLDEVYDEFLAAEKSMGDAGGAGSLGRPAPLAWRGAITLQDVRFQYPGAPRAVIEGLDLEIPKNSSLGIVGPTGCGKSTLVDLLLGLHTPTGGRILVDGVPLSPANHRAWQRNIGYVPQDIFLTDDTLAANIAFGCPPGEVDHAALTAAARAARILDFIERELPEAFSTPVGERGVRLSGGQRQRVGLARALYLNPGLLVLDEATSALDLATEAEVLNAIEALEGTTTIIMIAHRLKTVERCTRVLDLGARAANPS